MKQYIKCIKCKRNLTFSERINYNEQYMCPKCVYDTAPEDSAVRLQMKRNYGDFLK